MKSIVLSIFASFLYLNISAQTYNSFYGTIVSNTSYNNVLNDLTTFESFGIKQLGTTALSNTQNWIATRYQNLGYTDVVLQPFTYNNKTSNNIIVTKTGTLYPNTFLIIDAHYDTINGPGTNDNGTGTVLLLELARLLKDVETEYSIKFIHFSGEENGLIGSNYYVNNTVIPQNMDIKLVLNIDEVGGVAGMTNNTIVCERDQSSPQSNNAASNDATIILANCMELYSNLNTEISYAYASDYIPFENNGEIITGLYEKNVSPVNHTANDNLANMDPNYAFEVVKGALGASMEFAVAYDSALSISEHALDSNITLFPNPASKTLNITLKLNPISLVDFRLIDIQGKEILNKLLSEQKEVIKIDSLSRGTYLAVFKLDNQRLIKKVIFD
ncbi:M28 family peptidase [Subsaxibacter sp. CAU 1640]|uniref:M28 family peptidase n=1 Tax=Subsaxibacter sp. CAU 1640 TaxID=2933271 RepID=UPI0020038F23|nr:M28 family peptidase [Subsaxibacter sp. CAU 1640]MCK7591986.1 M28 family peptidase [Subsaxibacter sp. CAU 1640]